MKIEWGGGFMLPKGETKVPHYEHSDDVPKDVPVATVDTVRICKPDPKVKRK